MKAVHKFLIGSSLLLITSVGSALPVLAQVEAQRGIADPGRVQDRLDRPEYKPRIEPKVEVKNLPPQDVPPGAETITMILQELTIEGATVYSDAQLAAHYNDKIGEEITLSELYGIAAELTRKYRNDGYILTQVVIPPQTIENGQVTMQVVEGYINTIVVSGEGESDRALAMVRSYTNGISKNEPLNVKELERALLLINDLPGVEARSVLSPSASQSGAADMNIIVERRAYDAVLSADNYGTRYLGPWQLGAAVALNSALGLNERITLQSVVAPDHGFEDELAYGSLTYWQPLNARGTAIEASASYTETEPGYNLEQFDVEGWANNYRLKVEHPFLRTRSGNLTGYALFDWKDVRTKNNIPVDPTRKDNIRALRVGATAEMLDTLIGLGYNTVNVEFSKGLDIWGANNKGDLEMSRPDADPSFEKLTAEYQRLQRILSDVNFLLGVKGQYANDNLLSAEEFGIGGFEYGRGYDPSEVIGNHGVVAKAELQWTNPLPESPFLNHQLYTFYDAGTVWNDDATTNSAEKETLTSAGLGMRFDLTESFSGGVMAAIPLNTQPQTQDDQDARFYGNISIRF